MIEKASQSDFEISEYKDLIKKLACIKYKDVLWDTMIENLRKGHFVRIFPAMGTHVYD